jgi:hypothetical protein
MFASCERNSTTKPVIAPNCTIGSTQLLPPSPCCITTTCRYVKNSTDEGGSSRYNCTAEPTRPLPRRSSNQLHALTSASPRASPEIVAWSNQAQKRAIAVYAAGAGGDRGIAARR